MARTDTKQQAIEWFKDMSEWNICAKSWANSHNFSRTGNSKGNTPFEAFKSYDE
jgi:hypothetical protein